MAQQWCRGLQESAGMQLLNCPASPVGSQHLPDFFGDAFDTDDGELMSAGSNGLGGLGIDLQMKSRGEADCS